MKLRVMTYNIQHCCDHVEQMKHNDPAWDDIRPAQITSAIEEVGADLCALNEVYSGQPETVGAPLGFDATFAKAIDYFNGLGYGNALVSRYPVTSTKKVLIPTDPATRTGHEYYEDRVLLIAKIALPGGKNLTVFVCHFGLNEDEQRAAVDAILAEEKKTEGPLLLLGDFNVRPEHPLMEELRTVFTDTYDGDGLPTFPSEAPDRKIDYIYTRGIPSVGTPSTPKFLYSDHLPYTVDIEI